jgi:hypothetical protein
MMIDGFHSQTRGKESAQTDRGMKVRGHEFESSQVLPWGLLRGDTATTPLRRGTSDLPPNPQYYCNFLLLTTFSMATLRTLRVFR